MNAPLQHYTALAEEAKEEKKVPTIKGLLAAFLAIDEDEEYAKITARIARLEVKRDEEIVRREAACEKRDVTTVHIANLNIIDYELAIRNLRERRGQL